MKSRHPIYELDDDETNDDNVTGQFRYPHVSSLNLICWLQTVYQIESLLKNRAGEISRAPVAAPNILKAFIFRGLNAVERPLAYLYGRASHSVYWLSLQGSRKKSSVIFQNEVL